MQASAVVITIVLVCACLCLGYLAYRRLTLMRGGGVDVCLRRRSAFVGRLGERTLAKDTSAGWHFGVGRYRGDQLAWFRLTSFRPGASVVLDRTELEIVDRRPPTAAESYAIPTADVVLDCRIGEVVIELAMAPGVLTGFLSWLESAPPGRSTGYRQAS
ncbi:DUF2550 domain-containing protein [Pseudonocardia humida]|uniref:DUF2550 domain-containing protein n=1 Tax=Pseudonocardia humida TaxID=2800819 RepID=A0ABT1A560_9PSEU|nr:DUF2550 domain-containing protein [Pseudonocardia humida]MCO1658157.1 DUF2550 domain-containing protein [Pseudonocardia humida]